MNLQNFYQSHFIPMVDMACRYVSREDAEDVVQDIMAVLWERRDAMGFIDDLSAYAYSSVRNRCLDKVKHETYKREFCRRTLQGLRLDFAWENMNNHSPVANEVEFNEMMHRVNKAIELLPNRCRTIFCMSRIEGLHYREIGQSLGISENTVECQMTIALKKLRNMLKAV